MYKKEAKKQFGYLSRRFNLRHSNNGWFRFNNPFKPDKADASAGVNFSYDTVKDFRTGQKWTISGFIAALKDSAYADSIELDLPEIKQKLVETATLPDFYCPLMLYPDNNLSKRLQAYLHNRKLDPEYLDYKGFGYIEAGHYIGHLVIPIIAEGKLKTYFLRDALTEGEGDREKLRYVNPPGVAINQFLYNYDELCSDWVSLTEGWADAETIGAGAVASLGVELTTTQVNYLKQSPATRIYYVADRGYEKYMLYIAGLAPAKEIYLVKVGDYGKDANEIGPDLLFKAYENAIDLTDPDKFINYFLDN